MTAIIAILILVIVLPLIWVVGDFIYSRLIAFRLARWESAVERDPDGVRKGCREFTLGAGDPAIMMIHGFADTPALFKKMAAVLAEKGFTCRAIRLPDSSVPMAKAFGIRKETWLDAIRMEAAQLKAGHKTVWLMGHSMGAALAVQHAIDHPDEIAGLVLLAPLFQVSHRRSPGFSARSWYQFGEKSLIFTRIFESPFPLDVRDPMALKFDLHDRFIPRATYAEMFSAADAVKNRAANVKLPLIVFLSRSDRVVDYRAAERFFNGAGSAHKEIHYTDGAGHVIPLDNGWEKTTDLIAEFITRNPED